MAELNASLYHPQNYQSVAFKFFSESVKQIEKQILSTARLNHFTVEQMDFIALICDQFKKLVKLQSESEVISGILIRNFPEFFKPAAKSNVLVNPELTRSKKSEPVDKGIEYQCMFTCDICDEDVPILNNDFDYSSQLHFSSPDHQEVASLHRKIKESAASGSNLTFESAQNDPPEVDSVLNNMLSENKFASQVAVEATQDVGIDCTENNSSCRDDQSSKSQFADFLVTRNGKLYCCLCNIKVPGKTQQDSHFNGSLHKKQLKSVSQKPLTEFIITVNEKWFCKLCGVYLLGEFQSFVHKNGKNHQQNVKKFEEINFL